MSDFNRSWPPLMALAQKGDKVAYNNLLNQLMPVVRGYLKRRLSDESARDDVCQQIFIKIHTSRHTFMSEKPFEPWLFAIARSVLIDHFRSRGRRVAAELLTDEHFDEAAQHEEALGKLVFEEAFAALNNEQKEAIRLMRLEGLTVEDAAKKAGISPANMKVRLHRALKSLKTSIWND